MGNQVSRLPPSALSSPLTPTALQTARADSAPHSSPVQSFPHNALSRPGLAPAPGVHPASASSRHVQLFSASCLWHGASRLGWALQLDHSCGLRLALENVGERTVEHLPAEGCVEGGAFVCSRGEVAR